MSFRDSVMESKPKLLLKYQHVFFIKGVLDAH